MNIAAAAVAGIALMVALLLIVQMAALRRRLDGVPRDGDVIGLLRELDQDLSAVEKSLVELRPRLESLEAAMPAAVSHVGVVSYDAFGDITGKLSRSLALLDRRAGGMVLSVLVGRHETLFYAKQVRNGVGAEELSPEEQAAIERAMTG
jgi:hypothetical protein